MLRILVLLSTAFTIALVLAVSASAADVGLEAPPAIAEDDDTYPMNGAVSGGVNKPVSVLIPGVGDIGGSVFLAAGGAESEGDSRESVAENVLVDVVPPSDLHTRLTEAQVGIASNPRGAAAAAAEEEDMDIAHQDAIAEQEAILEVLRLQESVAAEALAEEGTESESRSAASALDAQQSDDEAEAETSSGKGAARSILNSAPKYAAMHEKKPNIVTGGPRVASHRVRFGETKSGLGRSTHAEELPEGTRHRTSMKAPSTSDSDAGRAGGSGSGRGDFSKRIQEALEASALEAEEVEREGGEGQRRFNPFLRSSDSLDSGPDSDRDNPDGNDAEGSISYMNRRFRVARRYSRPVEVILDTAQCPTSSHYDILGLRPTASPSEVKQAYRLRSLEVHPDKNPHPDAKRAFDALVTSYEVLGDMEERQRYDERQAVVRASRSLFKWSNIKIAVVETLDNWMSRFLLFVYRIRRGDWREEAEELGEALRGLDLKRRYSNFFRHYLLLPTWTDRAALAGEQVWDQKYKLLSVLLSWVALRGILVSPPAALAITDNIADFM